MIKLMPPYTPTIIDEENVVEAVSETVDLGSLPIRLSVNVKATNSAADAAEFIDGVLASGTITITDYAAAHLTAATGTLTVVDYSLLLEASATATITVVDYTQLAGAVLTVNGTALTEGVQWTAATNNDTTATSLEAAVEAVTGISSSVLGAVITATVTTPGAAGNAFTLATSDAVNLTISGATFTGGRDFGTVSVNGQTLTAVAAGAGANQFVAETSNDVTATNLEVAVEAVTGVNSTVATNVVTITAATPGTAGNSIALVVSGSNSGVTRSAATLTGGINAAVVTVAGHALTESTDWNSVTNNNTAADNLAAAIDALTEVQAANPGAAIITVKAATVGTAGNSIATVLTSGAGVTVQQATLAGGLNSDVDDTEHTITITDHGFSTGVKVNYDVDAGTTLDNLVDNTDYWVIKVDDDTIQLAATDGGAAIEIANADNAVGGGEFTLTPTALDLDVTVSGSNDGTNFVTLDDDTLSASGSLLYEYPTVSFRYLKVEAEPNASEVDVQVTLHSKL